MQMDDLKDLIANIKEQFNVYESKTVNIRSNNYQARQIQYMDKIIGNLIVLVDSKNEPVKNTWTLNVSKQCPYNLGIITQNCYQDMDTILNEIAHSIKFIGLPKYGTALEEEQRAGFKPTVIKVHNVRWCSYDSEDLATPHANFYFTADVTYIVNKKSGVKKRMATVVVDTWHDTTLCNGHIDMFGNNQELIDIVLQAAESQLKMERD
jgi:hypothetical protein